MGMAEFKAKQHDYLIAKRDMALEGIAKEYTKPTNNDELTFENGRRNVIKHLYGTQGLEHYFVLIGEV